MQRPTRSAEWQALRNLPYPYVPSYVPPGISFRFCSPEEGRRISAYGKANDPAESGQPSPHRPAPWPPELYYHCQVQTLINAHMSNFPGTAAAAASTAVAAASTAVEAAPAATDLNNLVVPADLPVLCANGAAAAAVKPSADPSSRVSFATLTPIIQRTLALQRLGHCRGLLPDHMLDVIDDWPSREQLLVLLYGAALEQES